MKIPQLKRCYLIVDILNDLQPHKTKHLQAKINQDHFFWKQFAQRFYWSGKRLWLGIPARVQDHWDLLNKHVHSLAHEIIDLELNFETSFLKCVHCTPGPKFLSQANQRLRSVLDFSIINTWNSFIKLTHGGKWTYDDISSTLFQVYRFPNQSLKSLRDDETFRRQLYRILGLLANWLRSSWKNNLFTRKVPN